MERAARRYVGRIGHVAFEDDALAALLGIGDGHRREQGLGIGMRGIVVEDLFGGQFDDLAQIHNRDPVGDMAHDAEVVGDEHIRKPHLRLDILQEIDDLGLDRDVEGRNRFVGDDKARFDGQGPGDADALALTAGKFVWVPAKCTWPAVGSIRRRIRRPRVVLPQPLSPTTPSVSPG